MFRSLGGHLLAILGAEQHQQAGGHGQNKGGLELRVPFGKYEYSWPKCADIR